MANTGGMIALVPTAPDAQKLAVPGGDPADEMHLTLSYLGDDVTGLPDAKVSALKRGTAAIARGIGKPVKGSVFGHAVFNPNSTEFDPAHVYLFNGPMNGPREVAHKVGRRALGDDYPTQHPNFVPHVTAGYKMPPGKLKHTGPVTFDRVRLALGDQTHDYPLGEAVTLSNTLELSAQTPALASVHHPIGDPAGPGLFKVKGLELPAYIQNIAHALIRQGHTESGAIQLAIGAVQRWARGGDKVSPEVRAAAAKALAEWEAARARAKAKPNKSDHSNDADAVELAVGVHQWKHDWIPLTPYAAAVKAKHLTGSTKGNGPGLPGKDIEHRAARDMSDEELKGADTRMEEDRKKAGLYSITPEHRAVKAELGRRSSEQRRKETRARASKKASATRKRRAEQGLGPKRNDNPFNRTPPGGWTEADKVPPEHQRPKTPAAKAKPAEPERKPFKDLGYMLAKRDTEMAALTSEERKVYDAANLRPSTEHERSYEGKGPMVQRTIFLTRRHEIGMRAVRAHRNAPRFAKYSDDQLRSLADHVEKGVKGKRARLHFEIRQELQRRGVRLSSDVEAIELSQPRRPAGNDSAGQWFADDPSVPRSAPVPTVNLQHLARLRADLEATASEPEKIPPEQRVQLARELTAAATRLTAGVVDLAAPKKAAKDSVSPSLVDRLYKVFLAKGMKPDAARRFAQRAALRRKADVKMANAVELAVPPRLRADARREAADDGDALPDGSWPIRNRGELADAMRSWGRAVKAGNASEVKAHMLKRAKVLNAPQAVLDRIQQLKG